MEAEKFTSLREAAEFADVSHETIREWCKRYGIGENIDGSWIVTRQKLEFIMSARSVLGRK